MLKSIKYRYRAAYFDQAPEIWQKKLTPNMLCLLMVSQSQMAVPLKHM